MIETFPHTGGRFYASPQRVGLTFWQWCARVIPIVLAIASTSLLAYYFYFDHRGQTELAKQQRQSNSEAADNSPQQPPQDVNPTQQAQAPTPDPQPQPSTPPQPLPADLGPHLPDAKRRRAADAALFSRHRPQPGECHRQLLCFPRDGGASIPATQLAGKARAGFRATSRSETRFDTDSFLPTEAAALSGDQRARDDPHNRLLSRRRLSG